MKKIRVLQVVHELGVGGIQSFLMNVYRNIDKRFVQFDFLIFKEEKGYFEDEIEQLGGKIIRITGRSKSIFKNRQEIRSFFKKHASEYDAIHCHWSNLAYIYPIEMAKKYGIKNRIVHAHSTNIPSNPINRFLHSINKNRIGRFTTHKFACSDLAGQWLFKNACDVEIINNGIKVLDYSYEENIRKSYRAKFNLNDSFIIGHVGRYCEAKNHPFLIKMFDCFLKLHGDSYLFLVGVNNSEHELSDLVNNLGISSRVYFLGMRDDVAKLNQMFDCFVLPSKWEGFPVSLLEAQASGLPCFASDSITNQAKIKDNVVFLKLDEGPETWAKTIANEMNCLKRECDNTLLVRKGYDISSTIALLETVYGETDNK